MLEVYMQYWIPITIAMGGVYLLFSWLSNRKAKKSAELAKKAMEDDKKQSEVATVE